MERPSLVKVHPRRMQGGVFQAEFLGGFILCSTLHHATLCYPTLPDAAPRRPALLPAAPHCSAPASHELGSRNEVTQQT